jgi:hypothetical protein
MRVAVPRHVFVHCACRNPFPYLRVWASGCTCPLPEAVRLMQAIMEGALSAADQ